MRSLFSAALLCSAVAFVAGCTNNMESPFKMPKQEIRNTVVVEAFANGKAKVNGASVDPLYMSQALGEWGAKEPGRKVTLIMHEGADPEAIRTVKILAPRSGLGEVTVLQKDLSPATKDGKKDGTATPAAPVPVYDITAVTIEVTDANEFLVNGVPVEFEKFSATLARLGKETPGKKVDLILAKGASLRTVPFVHESVKNAGLGAITAK